jgi:hypothetical protein
MKPCHQVIPINNFVQGADIYLAAVLDVLRESPQLQAINSLDEIKDLEPTNDKIISAEFLIRNLIALGICKF